MANFTNHENNKPLSKDVVKQIALRLRRGEAKTQIAKALGISHSVVRKYTDPIPWRIEESVRQDALRRLALGQSRSSIARDLGVSRQWVSELAPQPSAAPKRIEDDVREDLIKRVQSGASVAQAARELKIHEDTAAHIVRASLQRPDDRQVKQIKRKLRAGTSMKEIAAGMKIPLHAVQSVANDKSKFVRYSEAEKLVMAQQYSKGKQLQQVVAETGSHAQSVVRAYEAAVKAGTVLPRIELAMEDDRELLRVQRLYPEYEEWRIYAVQWYRVVDGNFAIACSAMHRFIDFLSRHSLFRKPADFFLRKNAPTIPSFFAQACPESDHGAAMNNVISDFLDWVLIQPEFADLSDDDEPTTFPMFRNPIRRVDRRNHKVQRASESNKKVMPYWMIHDVRRRIAQGPDFRNWLWVQRISGKLTASGDRESRDWFPVRETQIDKTDPDCVWRLRERAGEPAVLEMWSPVRWVACLLKFQTTARMGQLRMLDSGEGDTSVFLNGAFVRNEGALAAGTTRRPRRQGVLRNADGMTVLYFNTNKTQDIAKVGTEKGAECPWPRLPDHPDDPYYWIEKLRDWQAKYNPPTALLAWKDIPSGRRLKGKSDIVCSTYPDAVFLFRTAETEGATQFPVSHGVCDKAWQNIMAEYEVVLDGEQRRNPDGSPIKLIVNGRAEVSPHALRVSLITHLILDGDITPELMMKIVGHARFIMTIYYTKPGLTRIQDAIADATKVLDATKDETLVRDLSSKSAEQIRDAVVFNAKELVDVLPLNPADRNPLGWLPLHDGLCLAGGNTGPLNGDTHVPGCHNGGAATLENGKRGFGPVPGGVRNCCRCRWKCAGTRNLLGLQATLNNRQFHLHKAGDAAIDAERARNTLMQEKANIETTGLPFTKFPEMRNAERRYEMAMQKMTELALDVAAVYRMIQRIQKLPNASDGTMALAAQGDIATLHAVLEDTDSELLVLAEVCADVEFFPDLDPGTAVFEYVELLEQAFEREGSPFVFSRMPEREKLIAANAIMRELERHADPTNQLSGRRKVVEIMDRHDSLQAALGTPLRNVFLVAELPSMSPPSVRLSVAKEEDTQ
ncbi:MAG: VPA1269 family protein [Burkholderiales bacterium]